MLSASTISSGSSGAFSPRTASSTPLSQYSNSSTPKTSGNPLAELIETEKSYMETLKIIDSQLAPLWTDTSVTDFMELLKYVHDVLKANKRFCSKLTRIAANPQTIKELGDVLMQWIDDMEVPYANYSRAYISNLNTRKDILSNPAIQQLLQDLSRSASYEITLESLFNAPVQQLKYYKVLYGRLLDSAEPGRADHKLLVKANKRIDTVMLMAQKNMSSTPVAEQHSTKSHHSKALPIVTPIQTDVSATASSSLSSMNADLGAFQRQLDSSQAKDIFNGAHVQCQPRLATPGAKILLRDNFILLPDGLDLPSAQRVHVVLTTYVLVITQESNGSYRLMFPPIAVYDISVNAAQVDRELIGEYNVQVDVLGRKKILLRADTKETRNKWVGIDENASGSAGLTAKPMRDIVSKLTGDAADKDAEEGDKPVRTARKSVIRKQDIISFYTDQSGEISPLSSDESDAEDKFSLFGAKTPFSTKYDRTSKIDPSVKDLPPPPPTANAAAPPPTLAKDISPVPPPKQSHANHLQPATSIDNRPLPRAPSPVTSHHLENSGHSRPVSPRTIEIKHTVAPVAMQATTQSSEFLTNDDSNQSGVVDNGSSNGPAQQQQQPLNTNLPRTSSISRSASPAAGRPLPTPTRSSSFRQQQQQQQQQFAGGSAHPRPSEKALPQQPPFHHQSEQQHYYQHHHQPQPRLQSAAGPQQNMAQHWSPQQHQPPSPSMMAAPQQYRSAPSSPTQRPMMMGGNIPPMNRAPSPGMGPGGYPGQQDAPRAAAASNYLNVQRPSLAHHRSMEDLNSPPRSPTPNGQPSSIKQTLYSNGQCEVFHWKSESWYAVDGHCLLQVRQTFTNRSCVAIQLQNTGQLYLNAWILPNTVIAQPSPTDVSLTVHMGTTRENYLVHFPSPADATTLFQLLQRMHQEAVQMNMTPENSSTLRGAPPGMSVMMNRSKSFDVRDLDDDPAEDTAKVPQTLRLVMQCKCKLFVQNEHSNWSSFGSVTMKISQQLPSKKMHIEIENGKGPKATKLVSASVQSRNVERISPKRITFLLINEQERTSMVYMVQIKEEETGNKIFEYLKTKNAENGW